MADKKRSKKARSGNGNENPPRTFGPGVCAAPGCRAPFEKKTPWQKNCSTKCKTNSWIMARAERLKAASRK